MSVIDGIKSRQAEETRREITVDAWENATVYAKRVTAGDLDKVSRKHPNFIQSPTSAAMIELIIMKAEEVDGNKMFTLEHKSALLREPLEVIALLFGALMGPVDEAEHEKN